MNRVRKRRGKDSMIGIIVVVLARVALLENSLGWMVDCRDLGTLTVSRWNYCARFQVFKLRTGFPRGNGSTDEWSCTEQGLMLKLRVFKCMRGVRKISGGRSRASFCQSRLRSFGETRVDPSTAVDGYAVWCLGLTAVLFGSAALASIFGPRSACMFLLPASLFDSRVGLGAYN